MVILGGLFLAKKMEWIGKVEPTEVEFTKVARATIIEKVSASGKIQPEVEVKVSPDVSGEIVSLKVAEGGYSTLPNSWRIFNWKARTRRTRP